MENEPINLNSEKWKAYALSLEWQLNLLQVNLRPPIARIKGLADLLGTEYVFSEAESLEMTTAISNEAEEAMGYLEKLVLELHHIKKAAKENG
nr:hypothetical protein [Cytophagales bacterium]